MVLSLSRHRSGWQFGGLDRCNPYLNNRLEQDHRGIKQRYYPMRGFGSVTSAPRFCRAFDEVRQFFRVRTTMKQKVSLVHQRDLFRQRLDALPGHGCDGLTHTSMQEEEEWRANVGSCVLSSDTSHPKHPASFKEWVYSPGHRPLFSELVQISAIGRKQLLTAIWSSLRAFLPTGVLRLMYNREERDIAEKGDNNGSSTSIPNAFHR